MPLARPVLGAQVIQCRSRPLGALLVLGALIGVTGCGSSPTAPPPTTTTPPPTTTTRQGVAVPSQQQLTQAIIRAGCPPNTSCTPFTPAQAACEAKVILQLPPSQVVSEYDSLITGGGQPYTIAPGC